MNTQEINSTEKMGRIDTHHHIIPAFYVDALERIGIQTSGGRSLPPWTPDLALETMDTHGIAASVVSVSAPGVHFGDAKQASGLARAVNEAAADLRRLRPERFGFFASLPLPDVDASLAEIEYATNELGADGFLVLANSRGIYPGDDRLDAVFAELDRRSATVFVHPNELPGESRAPEIPDWTADFLLDTTRAAINLVASGTLHRYPNLKIILSHAGGFLPYVASRVATAGRFFKGSRQAPKDVLEDLQKFYFDTALSSTRFALPSLLSFADPEKILYGSDWPFAPGRTMSFFDREMNDYFTDSQHSLPALRANAERLFPRFKCTTTANGTTA